MAYSGWELDEDSRNKLLKVFVPKFSDVIAHHITLKFPVKSNAEDPPAVDATVVGYASDDGLECLVVSIDGSTERPDGKVFHITWSLEREDDRTPSQSNALLKDGWENVEPIKISATPKIFKD